VKLTTHFHLEARSGFPEIIPLVPQVLCLINHGDKFSFAFKIHQFIFLFIALLATWFG
jgi:hypothetical protein